MKLIKSTFLRLAAGLAVAGAPISLTACNCNTTANQKTPTLAFSFPTTGEILHESDNTNPSSGAGTIQVTVTLATTNVSAGSSVTLTVDGSPFAPSTVAAGGKVSFPSVILAGSAAGTAHSLQAGVSDSGGNGTASATVTVSVVLSGGTCTVTIAPVGGTIFNETGATVSGQTTVKDEDLTTPGMQAKITATTTCANGTVATLTAGSTQIGTGTVAAGQVIFDKVTLPDTPVTALTTAALRLQVTASIGTSGSGGSDTVGYIVDSSTPTCTITAPTNGATFMVADISVAGSTQGFVPQIAAGIAATVSIVDGSGNVYAPTGGPTQLKADGTFSAGISLLNGSDVLICEATTATGNLAKSAPVTVTANIPLSIAITQPTAGEILNVLLDENQSLPGLQTDIHLSTTAASGSITVCSTVAPTSTATPCTFGSGFVVDSTTSAGATQVLSAQTLGEGAQTLTAQITQGSQSAAATPVPIAVHTTRPSVTALTFSPDYVGGDGGLWLNSTNLADGGAATVATVAMGAGDTFVSDAGAQLVTLVVPATSQVLGTGSVAVTGGSAQAQIPLNLADGIYAMEARVSDVWGNPNFNANLTPVLTSPQADETLGVKTSLPSCNFTGPAGPYFNVLDNGGVVAGGSVNLPVTLSAANGFATVSGTAVPGSLAIGLSGGSQTSIPVTGAAIATGVSAPQGLDTITASISDPAGNPAQSCTPALSITVATQPPTLVIAPTTGWTPPPDMPNTSPPSYTLTRSFQIPVTTNAPDGTLVTSTLNGLTDGTGIVTGGAATLPENGINGTDTFVLSVQDVAGNVTTQQAPLVQINDLLGCGLFFSTPSSSPAYFNARSGTVTGSSLQTSIVLVSDCPATLVTLTKTPSTGTSVVATQLTSGTGVATFAAVDFADGETGTLSASIGAGIVTTAGPLTYYTKLTAPTLTAPGPADSPAWIVANTGNPNAGNTLAGTLYVASSNAYASGSNPYANAVFALTAANLGPAGGSNLGTAKLHLGFAGSTNPASQTLATDPQTVTFGPLNLPPDAASAAVTLTITDAAGNSTVQSWTVQTSAISPGSPVVTPTVTDQRLATVKLGWSAPADGAGNAVAGYDLRWALPAQLWGATVTDAQFFAATGVTQDSGAKALAGGAPGSAQNYSLTGLPPFNSWSIALRAVDAAGNRSEPISVSSVNDNTVAANPAQNWNQVTLSEGPNGNYFGYEMISADFNGDGLSDLAISDPQFTATPGTVWVLSGNSDPTKMTLATALTLTEGVASDDFGNNMAAGDFTGTGFSALAVGSLGWVGCQGRVDIYLSGGSSGLASTPALELQGAPGSSECFGSTVRSLGDVDGDGLPDLFVGAPFSGARFTNAQGNGYVFFSSSLKKDIAAGTTAVVPLSAADLVFNGNTAQQENFGYRSAAFALGTGFFVLPASGAAIEYAFKPSAVLPSAASVNGGIAKPIAATSAAFTLTDGEGLVQSGGPGNFYDSFGTAGIGGVSFTGGATPDVVISSAIPNKVYLYTTTATGVNTTPVTTLTQPSSDLGWMMAAADINGDGKQDLILGSNSPGDYGVFVYLNQGTSPYFVNTPSAVIKNGGDSFFGYGVATGHFHDANTVDLAIADGFTTAVIFY